MEGMSIRAALSMVAISAICLVQIAQAAPMGSLWASDGLTKVMRSAAPPEGGGSVVQLAGARREVVSGQAVFRPRRDVAGATFAITDLRPKRSDATIPAGAVRLQWVRYIDVKRNTGGIPADELVAKAPTSIPDPYWQDATIPVKANQAQPIWIEVHIPRKAPPGDYTGKLTVTADGSDPAELAVALRVWDFEMPAERHLSVVNWWRFPGIGFEGVKAYSDAYYDLLGQFCAFLVEHRQTDVNASIGLILEKGTAAEGYTHDTTRLERYAEAAFKAGIRQIQLHSVGRRTGGHTDGASRIKPVEANFRRLAALEKLVKRRGWRGRFAVSISDEPFIHHEESYAVLVDRVHKTAPSVRVIEAVETEFLGDVDIWVPKLSHLNLWYKHFDRVRRDGADRKPKTEMWYYTCCHPVGRYPNRFLDQSLLKARVLHWINYLYDLDGYLHWGLNHFAGDKPYTQEGISKGLPLGDRAIAYPGKKGLIGSLRFSAQRDGLQDFEYMWVLEDRLRKIKKRFGKAAAWLDLRQRSLEICRRVVWSFHDYTRDPSVMLDARRALAEEIEALDAEPLLIVQTSPPAGTVVPAGPRNVGVRGLVTPGAKVTINGAVLKCVYPSGYFCKAFFMSDRTPTITIAVEHKGKKRTVKRTFKPAD